MDNVKRTWFDEWDTNKLYQEMVENCNDCVNPSPVLSKNLQDGIVCGPILKFLDVDYGTNQFRGSIMIITKNHSIAEDGNITIEFIQGPSKQSATAQDASFTNGTLESHLFHTDRLLTDVYRFYRYDLSLKMHPECETMVRYSVNNEFKDYYRFYIPSSETNFNSIAYSCNGFSLSVDTRVFEGSLWFNVLNEHSKIHYNVMLGGGDQIYSDQIKLYCPPVKEWVESKDPIKKYNFKVDENVMTQLREFYLSEYINWYGFGHWKGSTANSKTTQKLFYVAMACIPSINMWDDHDIIDGFGSYSDTFMKTDIFSSIGKVAYEYYMLFQQQVNSLGDVDNERYLEDRSWILGATPGKFITEKAHSIFTRLGPDVSLLSVDCRTERRLSTILTTESYDLIFKRLEEEVQRKKISHLLIMLGIPIAYPRLVWLEWLFSSTLFKPLKWLSKKGYFMPGLVNEFNGDVELLDDMNDHWCAKHHKAERNMLVSRLQDFGAKHGTRITILSGDVHLASIGRFRRSDSVDKNSKEDPRMIANIISSAITNTPPPDGMIKLLQKKNNKRHKFDYKTIEDAVPIFGHESDDANAKRTHDCFYNNRNWSDIIPTKNALGNPYLNNKFHLQLGKYAVPGKITTSGFQYRDGLASRGNSIPYEITERGLIGTIHVEKDTANKNSDTSCYSMPIPELTVSGAKLSHSGMKHMPL
ncbi:hypothetical protein TPHA_0L02170 [Tetrapisispora phaffii CBS 4417]|uniref:PhoD-like phosphatase domain-containing protein n=1 Tax=Tetrapisispora phaffii (strain ATCC 24235 / CBS 4417 / NBRC 1672 / NRRL Y-8282 / UCD 70-5) TaxID=1071381 RepID=G8C090_TETPH|nr:hypothetical protein TPHA_0L02170 [Tetrapisispora phaffii CBS 4417]CCE65568.1 hypothetical protein TPHA_0L02170 [Tetrapisispora phaffii CBS 4417]